MYINNNDYQSDEQNKQLKMKCMSEIEAFKKITPYSTVVFHLPWQILVCEGQ
jgi:hypothetical protein